MENTPPSIVRATMSPSGRQYEVLPGQSLLEAGLSAGIALPFGCANGSCGDCQARLLSGQVEKIRSHDFVLTEAQKLDGCCLLCSTTAVTDVQIDVLIAASVNDIPQQQLQAKLCRVEQLTDVTIIAFKFVRGKALRFLPGQQVNITLKGGNTVRLPIASCPCNAQYVEFHLSAETAHLNELSQFGEKELTSAIERERIAISGPLGNFTLSNASSRPKLFISEGGEFGQLQGMIEQVLNEELDVPCCLLWKATDTVTHYRSNLCRSWHDAFDHFSFIPLPSNADVLGAIPKSWLVHLRQCEVYLGKKDSVLLQQLANLGIDSASMFYPDNSDQTIHSA